jgi:hypothetical protein
MALSREYPLMLARQLESAKMRSENAKKRIKNVFENIDPSKKEDVKKANRELRKERTTKFGL